MKNNRFAMVAALAMTVAHRQELVEQDIFQHFDSQGVPWTPAWDHENNQGRTVQAVRMPNGSWHRFANMVSEAEAYAFRTSENSRNFTSELRDSMVPLPRKLSNRPDHRDYHPSFMRVGLRVDGAERNDVNYYDMDSMTYETQTQKGLRATSIEPYWRYPETRQQRRARTRWEQTTKRTSHR